MKWFVAVRINVQSVIHQTPAFGATTLIPSWNWAFRPARGVKVKVKVKSVLDVLLQCQHM